MCARKDRLREFVALKISQHNKNCRSVRHLLLVVSNRKQLLLKLLIVNNKEAPRLTVRRRWRKYGFAQQLRNFLAADLKVWIISSYRTASSNNIGIRRCLLHCCNCISHCNDLLCSV